MSLRFADRQPLAGRFTDSTGPLVARNVVVVTGNTGAGDGGNRKDAAPEDVRGFDAETGKLLWTFHVVPQPGEFGHETWGNDLWRVAGDLGAWNPMTADEELGYVYIPLSSPTAAWYGGWRPGDNALDVKRESASGISRPCITNCGNGTTSALLCLARSRWTENACAR